MISDREKLERSNRILQFKQVITARLKDKHPDLDIESMPDAAVSDNLGILRDLVKREMENAYFACFKEEEQWALEEILCLTVVMLTMFREGVEAGNHPKFTFTNFSYEREELSDEEKEAGLTRGRMMPKGFGVNLLWKWGKKKDGEAL